MMSKIWMLTKVLMKTNLLSGFSSSKSNKKKNDKLTVLGVVILLVFVMGSLGVPIIYGINSLLEFLPIEKVLLSVILPLAGLTTIVFRVFSVVNVF